jgi:hypothetical protein
VASLLSSISIAGRLYCQLGGSFVTADRYEISSSKLCLAKSSTTFKLTLHQVQQIITGYFIDNLFNYISEILAVVNKQQILPVEE